MAVDGVFLLKTADLIRAVYGLGVLLTMVDCLGYGIDELGMFNIISRMKLYLSLAPVELSCGKEGRWGGGRGHCVGRTLHFLPRMEGKVILLPEKCMHEHKSALNGQFSYHSSHLPTRLA